MFNDVQANVINMQKNHTLRLLQLSMDLQVFYKMYSDLNNIVLD